MAIQHASPTAQEWGNAMLHEMEFVEGDWAALFWAIGGARALLQGSEVSMKNLTDVTWTLQRFEKQIRRRTVLVYVLAFGLSVCFGSAVFIFPNSIQRIGACLIIATLLFFGYQAYARRLGEMSRMAGPSALIESFRTELARQRDFHQGTWFWSRLIAILPGYLLFCEGMAIAHPETAPLVHWIEVCFVALAIVAVPLNLGLARKYQRQIDGLGILQKELP